MARVCSQALFASPPSPLPDPHLPGSSSALFPSHQHHTHPAPCHPSGLTTSAWAPASPSCWDGASLQTCTVLGKAESRDTKITAPSHSVPGSVL